MDCRDCQVPMVSGVVLAPVLGSHTHTVVERGDTIYPVGAALTDCLKCPECGHSVGPTLVRDDVGTDDLRSYGGYGV